MKKSIRDALIEVNRRFYAFHAEGFDASRRHPWQGWKTLWENSRHSTRNEVQDALRVLDVGCGNGRFALFLAKRCNIDYLGLDNAPDLLQCARRSLSAVETSRTHWIEHDLLRHPFSDAVDPRRRFDWIGLYGVLHHLPGFDARCALVRELADLLDEGGELSLSWWRFDRLPRWEKKTVPWEEHGFSREDLEPGDHLLTWSGEREHPRYCHAPDDAEIERFIESVNESPGLSCVDRFLADGRGGESNLYLVFRRHSPAGASAPSPAA